MKVLQLPVWGLVRGLGKFRSVSGVLLCRRYGSMDLVAGYCGWVWADGKIAVDTFTMIMRLNLRFPV